MRRPGGGAVRTRCGLSGRTRPSRPHPRRHGGRRGRGRRRRRRTAGGRSRVASTNSTAGAVTSAPGERGDEMTATIVLVPGAWSGAWIWEWLGRELDDRGLSHRAVDLVSVGEEGAGRDVRDDAKHVRAIVDETGTDVVLVGNSYGGAVISGASAGHSSVRRLVYLAAMMPKAGEPL